MPSQQLVSSRRPVSKASSQRPQDVRTPPRELTASQRQPCRPQAQSPPTSVAVTSWEVRSEKRGNTASPDSEEGVDADLHCSVFEITITDVGQRENLPHSLTQPTGFTDRKRRLGGEAVQDTEPPLIPSGDPRQVESASCCPPGQAVAAPSTSS